MSERKVDLKVGDTEVVKHEASMLDTIVTGETSRWTVDGDWYDSRTDAIQAAADIEDEKRQ
jgi:hypothetical protein